MIYDTKYRCTVHEKPCFLQAYSVEWMLEQPASVIEGHREGHILNQALDTDGPMVRPWYAMTWHAIQCHGVSCQSSVPNISITCFLCPHTCAIVYIYIVPYVCTVCTVCTVCAVCTVQYVQHVQYVQYVPSTLCT